MLEATTIQNAQRWCQNDPNPVTKRHVQDLLETAGDDDTTSAPQRKQLESYFPPNNQRISFGTAGLRSAMRPGPLGMNDFTVIQTAQGLAKYCLKNHDKQQNKPLIAVVGYDHRENTEFQLSSRSFAIFTALVFLHAGMECILLEGYNLTPLVPFSMQQLGAVVGIMITASHNPKADNGYKVYASDACQIRAPVDQDIADTIMDNLDPWTDYGALLKKRQAEYVNTDDLCLGLSDSQRTSQLTDAYFEALKTGGLKTGQGKLLKTQPSSSSPTSFKPPSFVYTAMHGVGHRFAKRAFDVFDLPPFESVPEQMEPDATFPTVPFPNPEEKGALDLAKAFAETKGCDIVLANDPDADRLAVAERDRESGEWTVFHGDQIGAMLGLWIWEQIGKRSDKKVAMCASTASSKLLKQIADVEGFHFEDTMTGFKWIGSRLAALNNTEEYTSLFGYEEAIGFCCGNALFDKDGISAMAVFAELACYVYRQDETTLTQHMQGIYDKYGEFVTNNGYFFMHDSSVVKPILDRIRSGGTYDIDVAPYKIESVWDLGDPGYDSLTADNKPTLPTSNSSPMITLRFTNGCVAQFRASGTEPKFKYYIEMKGEPGVPRSEVADELAKMSPIILEKLVEPLKNGLKVP